MNEFSGPVHIENISTLIELSQRGMGQLPDLPFDL